MPLSARPMAGQHPWDDRTFETALTAQSALKLFRAADVAEMQATLDPHVPGLH